MIRHIDLARLVTALLLIIPGMAGCKPAVNTASGVSASSTVEPSATRLVTRVPSASPLPTRPPDLTLTASLPPFPEWTPLPTLSYGLTETQLMKWLMGTEDCLLPCWGRIIPGVTTWQEAKQIMGEVVEFEAIHENITCNFGPCNHIEWRSRTSLDVHGFITSRSENLVHSISIEIYPPTPILRLDRILTQYGPPEKVFLNTVYHGMDDYNLPFGLTLTYPDHQFFIFFLWQAMKSGDNVVGCIQNWYVDLSIEPVSGKWPDEVVLRPLEEVTDLTIDEFYEKFRIVSGGECITTPGEYWP